jgi:CRISPR-associated protein Cmr1
VPAFLGNAEQSGQWRTPPFKALLRQWWRVAYAADHRFSVDVDRMREDEGRLFGAAADAADSNRSRVRIRLDRWNGANECRMPAVDPSFPDDPIRSNSPTPLIRGCGRSSPERAS